MMLANSFIKLSPYLRLFNLISRTKANVRYISVQERSESGTKTGVSESADLVRRIYNLARSGQTNIEIWRECTVRSIEFIDKLDVKGLCSILHSYGYMKYRDRNLLELISARLIENIRILNSSQVTSVLRAYSILNFRSDFLFRLMIPEISLRMDMMNVNQVSSIFYSYSNLGYYNKNLYQMIQSFIYSNIDKITPYELTLLLTGFCKNFKGFDERFLTVLSFQFCKLLNSYDNKLFSISVNSLSRLNFCKHKYLPSLIESEVYNRVKSTGQPLESRSLSLILNALSKHYKSCTPLFTFLSQTVLKRLKEFDLHSICLVLSSFSRVALNDPKTYDKIAEYVGKNSLNLYPRAIASIVFSFSRAKHLHGALFYFCGKHLELNISNYTCDEIAMILRSFSILNVKNEQLVDNFSKFILENTPDYVPIKFEDQCPHLRQSNSQKYGSDKDEKNEPSPFEGTDMGDCEHNINILEFVSESNKTSNNYLSNGKIHSLLWMVEFYVKSLYFNDNVSRSLTRISNELLVRMIEMSPFLVSRLIFSFAQLNFRHEACLEMLLNEVVNPRSGFKFDQKELSLIHYSIPLFGLYPADYGIYKLKRMDFQRMLETSDIKVITSSIVDDNVPSSKPMYLELLTNPLNSDDFDENMKVESEFQLDDSDIYVHIPRYLKELVKTSDSRDDSSSKIKEALSNHVNYNFNID